LSSTLKKFEHNVWHLSWLLIWRFITLYFLYTEVHHSLDWFLLTVLPNIGFAIINIFVSIVHSWRPTMSNYGEVFSCLMRDILWFNWTFGPRLAVLLICFPYSVSYRCMLGVSAEVWIIKHSRSVHWDLNSFWQEVLNWLWPQWTDIECSPFKPPHRFQAHFENLPNMESIVCKTINSQPKVWFNWRITLWSLYSCA